MNSTQSKGGDQPITQVTVSLAEIDALRGQVLDLKRENAELKAQNEALAKQLHDLTDPAKKTAAAEFRRKRGLT